MCSSFELIIHLEAFAKAESVYVQLKGSLESIQSLSQRAWRSLPLDGAECRSAMAKAVILDCVFV